MKKKIMCAIVLASFMTPGVSSAFTERGMATVSNGVLTCPGYPATCFTDNSSVTTGFVSGRKYTVKNINNTGRDQEYIIYNAKSTPPENLGDDRFFVRPELVNP